MSSDLAEFWYRLEENMTELHHDFATGEYRHGSYRSFTVTDNKRRVINVAPVRDRVVHRLLYEYLVELFDRSFVYDVWSCRNGKGLLAAIDRTQDLVRRYRNGWLWRADIEKRAGFYSAASYAALLQAHEKASKLKELFWYLLYEGTV